MNHLHQTKVVLGEVAHVAGPATSTVVGQRVLGVVLATDIGP